VKRYGKYGRKASWIVKPTFLPHFPYLFTIQLTFLLYFPYYFTIFFCIFHIFSQFSSISSMSFHYSTYFSSVFTIWKKNSEKIGKIRKKIVKRYGKYGRKASWIVKR
jgi:cellulose synthase/poly-beta-1,6-N-acetylglucosamine synthase-like glycosyltransferase